MCLISSMCKCHPHLTTQLSPWWKVCYLSSGTPIIKSGERDGEKLSIYYSLLIQKPNDKKEKPDKTFQLSEEYTRHERYHKSNVRKWIFLNMRREPIQDNSCHLCYAHETQRKKIIPPTPQKESEKSKSTIRNSWANSIQEDLFINNLSLWFKIPEQQYWTTIYHLMGKNKSHS